MTLLQNILSSVQNLHHFSYFIKRYCSWPP